MERSGEVVELVCGPDDRVLLSEHELNMVRSYNPELVEFVLGERDSIRPFAVVVDDESGDWRHVDPEAFTRDELTEGHADPRLFQFAHLVRPFPWVDDPRNDQFQELIRNALTQDGAHARSRMSTQDLWDALFTFARGERFVDGLLDSYAAELATVANDIRARLVARHSSG